MYIYTYNLCLIVYLTYILKHHNTLIWLLRVIMYDGYKLKKKHIKGGGT